MATEGTVAEGAELEIVEIPGLATCRACGGSVTLDRPFGRCVCGGSDLEWLSGEELRIREMEVA
jgi:hydrogenase nickel incorporation protein HypA/HybF